MPHKFRVIYKTDPEYIDLEQEIEELEEEKHKRILADQEWYSLNNEIAAKRLQLENMIRFSSEAQRNAAWERSNREIYIKQ